VLASRFRRLFLEQLDAAFKTGRLGFFQALAPLADPAIFAQRSAALRRLDWVVYAKPPFGGPEQVLAYLSRYTHRVAIANSRLIKLEDGRVSFRWRDYRHGAQSKVMTLTAEEFIRRFLLHALPDGFQRIRHYGLLANGQRAAKLALCRRLLAAPPPVPPAPTPDFRQRYRQLTGRDLDISPAAAAPWRASARCRAAQPPSGATAHDAPAPFLHPPCQIARSNAQAHRPANTQSRPTTIAKRQNLRSLGPAVAPCRRLPFLPATDPHPASPHPAGATHLIGDANARRNATIPIAARSKQAVQSNPVYVRSHQPSRLPRRHAMRPHINLWIPGSACGGPGMTPDGRDGAVSMAARIKSDSASSR
jgi:hypothetical protein